MDRHLALAGTLVVAALPRPWAALRLAIGCLLATGFVLGLGLLAVAYLVAAWVGGPRAAS